MEALTPPQVLTEQQDKSTQWFTSVKINNGKIIFRVPENYQCHNEGKLKIAAFNLIDTLIQSDRGDTKIKGLDDWVWVSDDIPSFLDFLNQNQYTVIIFTTFVDGDNLTIFQKRIDNLIKCLSFQPFVLASINKYEHSMPELLNTNKQPAIGLWNYFFDFILKNFFHNCFQGVWDPLQASCRITKESIDHYNSFYCGHLEGEESPNYLYRGGSIDSVFAKNIGLKYLNPDQILPKQVDPSFPLTNIELIVCCGQQGSGKSTFCENLIRLCPSYVIVIKEKTKKSYLKKVENLLKENRRVIVDATNPTADNRNDFLSLAKAHNVPARIFWFSRGGRLGNLHRAKEADENPIPEVALRTYSSYFKRPSNDEAPVVRIN